MIAATTFAGKRVAVFGLGRTGIVTCRSLLAGGAEVAAWDDSAPARDSAAANGVPLADLRDIDWAAVDALSLSPGVPLTHPEPHWTVKSATNAGVEIIGDTEIFFRERRARHPEADVVAITGTNGKSTTTALITHVLNALARPANAGGNIGIPILSLPDLGTDETPVYVIEMSSYQIDLTPTLDPTLGLLLNITPDHIDRHGTFEHYTDVKSRLIAGSGTALINVEDPVARDAAERIQKSAGPDVMVVSHRSYAWGYIVQNGRIGLRRFGDDTIFVDFAACPTAPALRGEHNLSNAVFAAAVADLLGLTGADLDSAFASFPGLPHRLEQVGTLGPVVFINDSKATNADSADKALAAFDRDIYWIAGGLAKEGGIAPLERHFPNIARAYLIGEAAENFDATLDGKASALIAETLDAAVLAAANDAAAAGARGAAMPVVLLSPACASFDQFASFEARGDRFRELVSALPGVEMTERSNP